MSLIVHHRSILNVTTEPDGPYLNKTLAHINKMQQKFSAETAPNLSHDDNGRNDTTARAVRNRQNLNGLKKVTFGNIDRA
jgi:hypothetical protein